MLEVLSTYHYIIIFFSVIIVSYFFSSFSKKSGVPSVLMLIALGIIVNIYIPFQDRFDFILEVLGTVGLILIVLDGALGLKLLRSKTGIILKSLFVSLITLVGTSYISALFLNYFFDLPIIHSLLLTVPLSILSSAILLPSIDSVEEKKREFLIYESTFSDIIGIIVFVTTLSFINPTTESSEVYGFIVSDLIGTTVFSIVISCFLIYLFQKLKGQIAEYKKQQEEKRVSLKEDVFFAKKEENSAQEEAQENLEKRANGETDVFPDTFYNQEVLNITGEYIRAQSK